MAAALGLCGQMGILTLWTLLFFGHLYSCATTNGLAPATNNSISSIDLEMLGEETSQSSTIYFNNPHLLKDQKGFLKGGLKNGLLLSNSDVETIGGIYLRDEAQIIATHLRTISNEELGVTALQAAFDSLSFVSVLNKEEDHVKLMADRLHAKLHKYTTMLQKTKSHIQDLYWWHIANPLCHTLPCCAYWDERAHYSEHFGKRIIRSRSCDVVPPLLPSGVFCPGQNLTQLFQDNLSEYPTIKWQYFISQESVLTQYPAHESRDRCKDADETRHREIYIATVAPQTKFVVILIDHGNSMSAKQMEIAKAIGKYIIGSLSHQDQVGLIGLSGEPSYPRSDDCLSQRMAYATLEAKLHFTRFMDGLTKSKDSTNHSLGFTKAFEMIRNTLLHNFSDAGDAQIIYISRGLLSSLTEARTVIETIADENELLGDRVAINTFTVIDDGKTLMYEKKFMQDIANQNFSKYNPEQINRKAKAGVMVAVNTTYNLGFIIGNPFQVLNLRSPTKPYFSLLHWDSLGKGLVLSIAQSCLHRDQVIGVVGMDAHLADVAEDITSYNQASNSYAFLIDVKGYIIAHPLFTRDALANEQPMHTDISHLENRVGFFAVWEKMRRMDSGVEMLVVSQSNKSSSLLHVKYAWKKVKDAPYIICIVTENPDAEIRILKTNEVATPADIVYHQLPMSPEIKKCRHLRQLATTKAASLFLSAPCFYSPFEYLTQEETRHNIQGYMAYISDKTKLIANPGLKSNVRSDVASLVHITDKWKKQFVESSLSQYIVRRYAATPRGVFQVYPGTPLEKSYDPTKRPWFTSALDYPGRVVLSAPYLDSGGAGYIVTVSHTIYEGKSAAMHSTSDAVVAVIGVDFTLGYFHKVLMKTIPMCNHDRVTCFILDDRGYLISHPDLIEPNGRGPVEQQHITHKEPLVANDILNHKGFVRKNLCNSFSDRTVQRFYQFNVSLEGTLTNLVHGEHCAKYQIVSIPGTNTFLGIVNQTCDMVTAFCPCSMVDRLCLNCHRMEQSECECPCECPLEVDLCTGELLGDEDANPSCRHVPDDTRSVSVDVELLNTLEPCMENKCSSRTTQSDCFGVMGCEWCQFNQDASTPLAHPFCSELRRCFGGVLGAQTPYADEVKGMPLEEFLNIKSTPVGPVAGGIMGCFLVLALGVYCYRHRVHRSSAHQYVSSVPDTQVRMSQLDEVDDLDHHEEQSTVGHANIVLAGFENALNISPYRISTNYRRPAGGDSDHGYSTMTPHEDSEHMPYVEPLLIGRDKYRPTHPQSVTSSSRTSSPIPHPLSSPPTHFGPLPSSTGLSPLLNDPSQTVIPDFHPHHVLASVQVHMVDAR